MYDATPGRFNECSQVVITPEGESDLCKGKVVTQADAIVGDARAVVLFVGHIQITVSKQILACFTAYGHKAVAIVFVLGLWRQQYIARYPECQPDCCIQKDFHP